MVVRGREAGIRLVMQQENSHQAFSEDNRNEKQ